MNVDLGVLVCDWAKDNAPNWKMDWGTHDASRPVLKFEGCEFFISDEFVSTDFELFPEPRLVLWAADPDFFDKLKTATAIIERHRTLGSWKLNRLIGDLQAAGFGNIAQPGSRGVE